MPLLSRACQTAALYAALGTAAVADDADVLAARHGDALYACIGAGGDLGSCRGLLSDACMAGEAGGGTTLGMVACLTAEAAVWDDALSAESRSALDWARSLDDADAAGAPGSGPRAEALGAAQEAWGAFRDAECALSAAIWGEGSMRLVAGASCRLDMTAARAAALRALREGME